MIESLVTVSEGSVGLAIAEMLGGLVAGMLLMFYRDVAATERIFLLPSLFADRFWDHRIARQLGLESQKQQGSMWNPIWTERVGNEEYIQLESSELLRFRIESVKAVTFSLGVIVLGSSLTLILFSGLSINEASWILVGLAAGGCVEHAVWLFARIPQEGEQRQGRGRSLSEIADDIRNLFTLKWPPPGSVS